MSAPASISGQPVSTSFSRADSIAPAPPIIPWVPDHFALERRQEGNTLTLVISGEVDLASIAALRNGLGDIDPLETRRIVADLSALEFIDVTGISVLLEAQQRADADGYEFVLTHVPPHAKRLFRIAGVDTRLQVA